MCETRFNLNDIILWKKRKQLKKNRNSTLHDRSSTTERAHNTKTVYIHPLPFRSIAVCVCVRTLHCSRHPTRCSHLAFFQCSSLLDRFSLYMMSTFRLSDSSGTSPVLLRRRQQILSHEGDVYIVRSWTAYCVPGHATQLWYGHANGQASWHFPRHDAETVFSKRAIPDGWEVFRFQVSEEHRINQTFMTVNDFLEYWLKVYNSRQESSRLEPMYMKKHTKNQSGECPGPIGVQQEASERYKKLSYTDKAIYRAIGKEYFRKKK